ncbi:hypothetical protein FUAX_28680 [Fulvitalea axinellae]|uniref:Uncharacterized protein n=2 Tax=Fulvitalea axinellae TaxID=1182444 RepID=A0AAU9DBG0_9BACT|nr:hypothetical protein FUAX_28680 [Fulvitalea axinellae]
MDTNDFRAYLGYGSDMEAFSEAPVLLKSIHKEITQYHLKRQRLVTQMNEKDMAMRYKEEAMKAKQAVLKTNARMRDVFGRHSSVDSRVAFGEKLAQERRVFEGHKRNFDEWVKSTQKALHDALASLDRLRSYLFSWHSDTLIKPGDQDIEFGLMVRMMNQVDQEHAELIALMAENGFKFWLPDSMQVDGREADDMTHYYWQVLISNENGFAVGALGNVYKQAVSDELELVEEEEPQSESESITITASHSPELTASVAATPSPPTVHSPSPSMETSLGRKRSSSVPQLDFPDKTEVPTPDFTDSDLESSIRHHGSDTELNVPYKLGTRKASVWVPVPNPLQVKESEILMRGSKALYWELRRAGMKPGEIDPNMRDMFEKREVEYSVEGAPTEATDTASATPVPGPVNAEPSVKKKSPTYLSSSLGVGTSMFVTSRAPELERKPTHNSTHSMPLEESSEVKIKKVVDPMSSLPLDASLRPYPKMTARREVVEDPDYRKRINSLNARLLASDSGKVILKELLFGEGQSREYEYITGLGRGRGIEEPLPEDISGMFPEMGDGLTVRKLERDGAHFNPDGPGYKLSYLKDGPFPRKVLGRFPEKLVYGDFVRGQWHKPGRYTLVPPELVYAEMLHSAAKIRNGSLKSESEKEEALRVGVDKPLRDEWELPLTDGGPLIPLTRRDTDVFRLEGVDMADGPQKEAKPKKKWFPFW